MKLLITGSRKFDNYGTLKSAIEELENRYGQKITMLLHGGAKGADTLAQQWAKENNIQTLVIKPDYENHEPKVAPLIRNKELVKLADLTLAFYSSQERKGGTWFTAQETIKNNKHLYECFKTGRLMHTSPVSTLF